MIQKYFKKKVKEADISNPDWLQELLDELPSCYAKGYLNAKMEELRIALDSNSEEYREAIIDYIDNDIWE